MSQKVSYKLAGDIYMAEVNSLGVLQGNYIKQGNMHPLEITVTKSDEDMSSALRDTAGQILESKTSIDTIEAAGTLRQWGVEELAQVLAASIETMTGEAGSVVAADGVVLVAPTAGEYVFVGKTNISNLVLSEDTDTDPATYENLVDFLYDEHLGLFTIIDGGAITAGDDVRYAYDYAAETGKQLNIGKIENSYVAVMGSLINLNTGDTMRLHLYMVSVSASGGTTLISDPDTKFEELPTTWKLLTPDGKTSPGTLDGVPL